MLLSKPVPPREALASLARRQILPTNMSSYELQRLAADIRQDSFYSARTLLEDLLDQYKGQVGSILNPQRVARAEGELVTEGLNIAKAREQAKDLLQQLGYLPNVDERGTIKDLSSDGRINLVLQTNVQVIQGEAWWTQGQDEAVLDQFPAQELFRAEGRKVERNWIVRFRLAGEQTGDPIGTGWTITPKGKMVALKNHAIWERLGDPKLFKDGLGNPWPPFAFASGMNVRDVDRAETESIGLIKAGQSVKPMTLADLKEAA